MAFPLLSLCTAMAFLFLPLPWADCPKLMADDSFLLRGNFIGLQERSPILPVNENAIIYSKRMEIELKERKELPCCLNVIFPAHKENVSPSRIKNVGGQCKSGVSRNCEALKEKETQWATGDPQLKADIWRCNTLKAFIQWGSETLLQFQLKVYVCVYARLMLYLTYLIL